MSRLTKYRVAWGSGAMAVIATVVLGFLLNQIWEPASAEGQLSSGLLVKVQSDLASADALLESGDLAAAALSYVALMDSHPGNSASVLDERLDDIGDLVETSAPDTSAVAALMGALPPLDSMGTPAGRYALLRLVLLKLAKMSHANPAGMEQLRASTYEALLESLWETPSDPYTYDLAAEALDLAEAIGPEQVATLVTNFQTHLSSATSSMGTLSARVQLMKLFESSENWSARNGLIGAVLADAVSESVIEALSRDDSLPHHRASVLSAQVSAELLSGDYVGAVEALDSVDWQDDPDTDDNDFPPAVSLTDLGDSAAKSKLRATKTQPSTAEGLPLTDRVDVLDTQNPILRFRMRLPGAEVSGDPELAGNQRIVEVHANPVFYPDEDDSSLLKPVKIELNEEIQADGSTAWMEDRNTLKYLGDSKARQFYRLGEYKLRIAPLFAGSETAVSAVLRQRLASQPSEVIRSGGGILAAEGILGDGVDFMHETVPGMVKEFVTLQAVPDLPVSAARWILGYRWSADGLTPVLLDGEVHWKNAGGDTVLRFPAPVAWDAAGASIPISYVLRNSVVALVVPAQALRTAVYPVVLDPTVTTGVSDLSANLSTRYKVSGEWRYKSMYGRLALPDLTGFSSIDQATFYAKIQSTDGGAVATSAYCDAKGTWTESTSYSTLEAFAFPNATASQSVSATSGWVNWNVLGSTSTTGIAKIYASDSSPDPATVKVFATSYTGTPNSQTVELTLAESSASPYRTFHTRTASSGNAPYLQIVYTLAPAAPTSNFTANVTSGEAPLNVSFSDTSNGNGGTINAWSWTFGDGGTSTSQNPTHAFTAPGTYTVALTVTSAGGADGETKTGYITVADTTPPVFTLLGPNPYTIEYGDEYVEYAAEAIDTVDGDISEDVTIGGDTVNTEVLGDYTVTYDVEDSHANAATTLSRLVSVVDATPPELALIGDNPLEIEYGLPYVELGATATDTLDGDLTEEIIIGGEEVLTGQLGEYSVTYDVEDSHGNNAEQVVRVVEVVDTIAPTLTLNGDDPMEIELGATFTDPMASAQDAVYGDLSSSIEVGGDTVDPLTVGEYVITYDVTDPSGNSADTITRLVRVFDPFPDLTVLGPVNGSVHVTQPPSLNVVASGAPDTTFEYPHGSTVRLEAIAEPGYTFWSWGEDLPTGRNTIVFEDSFPDEELDSAWTVTGGDWSVTEGGTLRAIPSANEFPTISRRNVASDFEFLYAYNRKSDTGSLWHYLRWEDDENYLLLQISESHIRLREMDNGLHEYLLVSREMPSHIDNWYAISVRCEGEAVTIERTPAGGSKEEVISYTGVQTSGTSQAIFSTYAGVSFELDNVFLRNLRNSAYLEMDSSKTVSATFIQADTTAPVISLLGNSSIELACGENFVDPGATATDARYGDLTSRILVGGNTGTFTEPGTYTITYNVSDEEGNAAQEVTRTVIITADSTPPEISLNGESIVYLRKGDDYEELGAIALDACQGEVEVDLDSSSVNTAVFGTYIVEYDAVDTSDNIAQTVHREVRVWPTLSITIEGEGTTDPGVPADGEYLFFEPGSTASISAVQTEPSSVFDRWYGAGNGGITASSRTILMSTSQSVTAKFVAARELVIQFFGEGSLQYGTDGSITEPETPETVYLHPSERTIAVSAVPEEGISEFVQWALGSEAAIYEPTSVIDIGPLLHQGEKKYLNATFAPIGTVDYFDVTLTVEGNGTTIPAPGIYRIPRFKQLQPECFLACQEETNPMPEGCFGCNVGNSFLVGAEADANWVLKGWQAPGHVEVEPRLGQKFHVEDDITITAQFIERPGATELDLFTAVGELFVEAGEISSTSELYTKGLDYGEFQFDSAGDLTWTGNGIPDAAEISLLLSVLVNPHLDLSRFGGVAHTFVWEDFATNQARAALDLPSQTVNIQNAVAAYMTLGSYGHVEKLIELVASTYSVTLDSQDYVSSSVELFKPDGDADGDGIPNNLEWQLTPVHSGASGPSLGAWSYPLWALNPELPMSGPALAGASVVSSVKAISSAAPALSLANSVVDCDCPDGSLATSLVTLTDSADVTVAHRLSCGNLVLGTPTSVKRGRTVTLSATEAFPGAFVKWNAPGTLIHGSALRRETLSITEDTVSIAPSVMDMPVVTIYDPNAIVTVLRGSAAFVTTELVPDSLDPDGIEIQAPQGTLLQVTCSNCDGWEATENHGGNAITRDRNIVFPMGFDDMTQLYPLSEFSNPSNLPYRRFTHYASTDGGGSALIGLDGGGTHGTVVTFLGQATERSYWGATPPSASHTIKLLARENPGYQFRQWIGLTSGSTSHSPSVSFATEDASSHLNAQAIFVAKSTLQWQSKAFGASPSMRGDCFGYCRVSPAQKYYDLPVGSAGPEIVQVIAVPQPGYSFEKWVGLGDAWTSAVNDNGEWASVSGASEAISGCDNETIYLKMANSENGPVDHNLYAVYSRDADNGTGGSGIKLTVDVHGLGHAILSPEPDPHTGYYAANTLVTVTQEADTDWQFEKWDGQVDDGQDPESESVQVTMSASKTIDLFFQNKWTLKLSIIGEGSAARVPDQPNYETGTDVVCTATAASGWQFTGWKAKTQEGDRTENPTTVNMDSNKEFDVIFLQERLLTVNVAFDDGTTVTPGAGGSVQTSMGSSIYLDGQKALLEVYPSFGNVLARWEGPNGEEVTEEGLYAALVMNDDKEITAVFEDGYTLSALVNGPGTVSMAPVAQAYRLNQQVGVTVHPAPGWSFAGWIGDTTGIADTGAQATTVIVSGDMTIHAAVIRDNYALTLQSEGPGMIEAVPNAPTYPSFDVVEIVPTALPGTKFDHWENGEGVRLPEYATEVPLRLTMDGPKTIRGVFRDKAVLHIESEELIVQNPLPGEDGTYPLGTEVTLTAAPAVGKLLSNWEGDAGQTGYDPLVAKVKMDSDKWVLVTFEDAHLLTVNTITGPSATTWPGESKDYIQSAPLPQFWFRPNSDMGQSLEEGQFVGYLPVTTEKVTLKARDTVGDGQVFHHWEDALGVKLSRDLELELEISGDTTVSAVYIDQGPRLTVNMLGEGTVTLNDDLPKEYRGLRAKRNYSEDDEVSIHAEPIPGYYFDHWVCSDESADLHDTTGDLELTLTEDTIVSAIFIPEDDLIAFDGDVNEDGAATQGDVDIVRDAMAANGSTYSRADVNGDGEYDLFDLKWTIDGKEGRNQDYVIALETMGIGIIKVESIGVGAQYISTPANLHFAAGTLLTLTAYPHVDPIDSDPAYRFLEWTGDSSGQASRSIIRLTRNMSVAAVFALGEIGQEYSDSDNDGLSAYQESVYGTDPQVTDSDGDGLPDGWEVDHSLNPSIDAGAHGATGDPDNDEMENLLEYQQGNDPSSTEAIRFKVYKYLDGAGNPTAIPTIGLYKSGEMITLKCEDVDGWPFSGWEGDSEANDKSVPGVAVYNHMAVRGTFKPLNHIATFVRGAGSAATDDPDGVYLKGTGALLTAIPDEGWSFAGWSRNINGNEALFESPVESNIVAVAHFERKEHKLSLRISGTSQQVEVLVDGSLDGTYTSAPDPVEANIPEGAEVTLIAHPDTLNHWIFTNWTGTSLEALTKNRSSIFSFVMDRSQEIGANFSPTYPVSLEVSGDVESSDYTLEYHPNPEFLETTGNGVLLYYAQGEQVRVSVTEHPEGLPYTRWCYFEAGLVGETQPHGERYENYQVLVWPGEQGGAITCNFSEAGADGFQAPEPLLTVNATGGANVRLGQVKNSDGHSGMPVLATPSPQTLGSGSQPKRATMIQPPSGPYVNLAISCDLPALPMGQDENDTLHAIQILNKYGKIVYMGDAGSDQLAGLEQKGAPWTLNVVTIPSANKVFDGVDALKDTILDEIDWEEVAANWEEVMEDIMEFVETITWVNVFENFSVYDETGFAHPQFGGGVTIDNSFAFGVITRIESGPYFYTDFFGQLGEEPWGYYGEATRTQYEAYGSEPMLWGYVDLTAVPRYGYRFSHWNIFSYQVPLFENGLDIALSTAQRYETTYRADLYYGDTILVDTPVLAVVASPHELIDRSLLNIDYLTAQDSAMGNQIFGTDCDDAGAESLYVSRSGGSTVSISLDAALDIPPGNYEHWLYGFLGVNINTPGEGSWTMDRAPSDGSSLAASPSDALSADLITSAPGVYSIRFIWGDDSKCAEVYLPPTDQGEIGSWVRAEIDEIAAGSTVANWAAYVQTLATAHDWPSVISANGPREAGEFMEKAVKYAAESMFYYTESEEFIGVGRVDPGEPISNSNPSTRSGNERSEIYSVVDDVVLSQSEVSTILYGAFVWKIQNLVPALSGNEKKNSLFSYLAGANRQAMQLGYEMAGGAESADWSLAQADAIDFDLWPVSGLGVGFSDPFDAMLDISWNELGVGNYSGRNQCEYEFSETNRSRWGYLTIDLPAELEVLSVIPQGCRPPDGLTYGPFDVGQEVAVKVKAKSEFSETIRPIYSGGATPCPLPEILEVVVTPSGNDAIEFSAVAPLYLETNAVTGGSVLVNNVSYTSYVDSAHCLTQSYWIEAVPDEGFCFTGWGGDAVGRPARFSVTLDQDLIPSLTAIAMFDTTCTNVLTLTRSGNGSVSVTPATDGGSFVFPDDDASGAYSYQDGPELTLEPMPEEGDLFYGWLVNGVETYEKTLRISMGTPQSVTAIFKPAVALDLSIAGGGGIVFVNRIKPTGSPQTLTDSTILEFPESQQLELTYYTELDSESLGWVGEGFVEDLEVCNGISASQVGEVAYICLNEPTVVQVAFAPVTGNNGYYNNFINGYNLCRTGDCGLSRWEPHNRLTADGLPSETCPVDDIPSVGHPVFPFNGEYYEEVLDYRLRGRGQEFEWSRTYRSKNGVATDQGNNWDHSYNIVIALPNEDEFLPRDGTCIMVCNGGGRRDAYKKAGSIWTRPESFATITKDSTSQDYRMTFEDNSQWIFFGNLDSTESTPYAGKIKESVDRNGNRLQFVYQGQSDYFPGKLHHVIDAMGRQIDVNYYRAPLDPEYKSGKIKSVRIGVGSDVSITYDYYGDEANGNPGDLKSVTKLGNTTTYTYSKHATVPALRGNLLTITDPRGNTYLKNEYYPDSNSRFTNGTINLKFDSVKTQQWGYEGEEIDFSYARLDPDENEFGAALKTTVVDRNNKVKDLYYDPLNRGVREVVYTDSGGSLETVREWDKNSQLLGKKLPNGVKVSYVYDPTNPDLRLRGNLKAVVTYPFEPVDGIPAVIERFEYENENGCGGCASFVSKYTSPNGEPTVYEYDERGNREHIEYPDGGVESFVYWPVAPHGGELRYHTLPDNGSGYRRKDSYPRLAFNESLMHTLGFDSTNPRDRSETYDDQLNLVYGRDEAGAVTYFTYNPLGLVTTVTSPGVEQPGGGVFYYRTLLEYDENYNIKDIARGKLSGTSQEAPYDTPLDAKDWTHVEFQEYDILNMLKVKKIYTSGHVLIANGLISHSEGATAVVTEYDYDGNRNVTQIRSGEAVAGTQPNNIVELEYNERNLVKQVTRGGTDEEAISETLKYDGIGNLAERSRGTQKTVYTPDGYGRIRSVKDSMGNVVLTKYDANGNVTSRTIEGELVDTDLANGNQLLAEQQLQYDPMNRVTDVFARKFDPAAGSGAQDPFLHTSTQYNNLGGLISIEDDSGYWTGMIYNQFGEVDSILRSPFSASAQHGTLTKYDYDEKGNVEERIETTINHPNAVGSGIPPTTVANFQYDAVNRPLWNFAGGRQNFLSYDSRSNLTKLIDAEGNESFYSYDNMNRLLSASTVAEPADPTIFSQNWDDNSRIKHKRDGDGNQIDYAYDVLDRVERVEYAGQVSGGGRPYEAYTFDALGRVDTHRDRNGATVTMHYDKLNRLTQRDFVASAYEHPVFTHEYFKYDGASRMVEARNDYSKVLMRHDSTSNLLSESLEFLGGPAPAGPFEVSHTYDTLGRPTLTEYPGGRILDYAYNVYNQDLSQILEDDENLVSYAYYTRDLVGRKHLGPDIVAGQFLAGQQYYPGSWDDYLDATQPSASIAFEYRGTGGSNPTDRIAVESVQFGFNRGGGAWADPYDPPPITYDNRVLAFEWDRNFNKTSAQDSMPGFIPLPRTSAYEYDHLNRLADSNTQNSAATSSMSLDYDDLGRLGNRDAVLIDTDAFSSGNVYELDPEGVDPNAYVVAATTFPGLNRDQAYDDNGNLTTIDGGSGNTRTFGYDPNNRLVHHSSTVGLTTKYLYDALGRRIQSTVVHSPSDASQDEITRFLYSGHRVIEERDKDDNVLASYVYGRGLDEVVSMRRDVLNNLGEFEPDGTAEDYFYLGDMQNNTLVLVDAEGQMVESYAYGTELRPYVHFEGGSTAQQYPNDFGMPVILDETGAVLHADFTKTGLPTHYQSTDGATAGTPYGSRYGNPWLFNGRAWDAELGLYHYRNRYLDPVQGRFTTRDPIGIWGDSMNLGNGYSYVGNNPWTYVDPFGLESDWSIWGLFTSTLGSEPAMNPNRFVDFDPAALEIRHQVYNAGTGQAGQVVEEGIHYGVSQGVQIGAEETLIGLAGVGTIAAVEAANDVGLFDGAWRWCKSLFRGADEAMEGREIVNGAQLPRTLAQQRELARLAAEVREELLNNLDLLEQQLSEAQIRALAKDPGLMQRYFGTVLEARVASQVNQIVRSDPDSVLSGLHWTGLTKAPQDFIGPNGHGFDITGSSRASIMDHNARPAVNAVITYESVPRDLGNQFNNR